MGQGRSERTKLGIVADIGRVEKFPTPMAANAPQLFLMISAGLDLPMATP